MRKVYIDKTGNDECLSIFINGAEVIWAGATTYSMPLSDYDEEYQKFADEYDIHFIFDNAVPQIDFYTVPQFDIFATDSEGGYIGTIGNNSDFDSDYNIGYIDINKRCFLIAMSAKEFVKNAANWKKHKQIYVGIQVFESKEVAQNKLEFIEIPKSYNLTGGK